MNFIKTNTAWMDTVYPGGRRPLLVGALNRIVLDN